VGCLWCACGRSSAMWEEGMAMFFGKMLRLMLGLMLRGGSTGQWVDGMWGSGWNDGLFAVSWK